MKDEPVKIIKYKGKEIKIYQDDSCDSPDDWGDENVFLVGYHRDFEVRRDNIISKDKAIEIFGRKDWNGYWIFGLEAYIHSGVVLALSYEGNYPDRRWDVSQLGLAFVSKKETRLRKTAKERAENLVQIWDQYLSGDVYGYDTDRDSCWGYYGMEDCIEEAKFVVDYQTQQEIKGHTKLLKKYIKNKVPIMHRRSLCV